MGPLLWIQFFSTLPSVEDDGETHDGQLPRASDGEVIADLDA